MSRPTVVIVCILAPPNRGGLNSTHIHGTSVPVEEPSTASKADKCAAANDGLLDHLVSDREQLVGNIEAERPGGFEIDDQLELSRQFDRDVGGLSPAHNFVDNF